MLNSMLNIPWNKFRVASFWCKIVQKMGQKCKKRIASQVRSFSVCGFSHWWRKAQTRRRRATKKKSGKSLHYKSALNSQQFGIIADKNASQLSWKPICTHCAYRFFIKKLTKKTYRMRRSLFRIAPGQSKPSKGTNTVRVEARVNENCRIFVASASVAV